MDDLQQLTLVFVENLDVRIMVIYGNGFGREKMQEAYGVPRFCL